MSLATAKLAVSFETNNNCLSISRGLIPSKSGELVSWELHL